MNESSVLYRFDDVVVDARAFRVTREGAVVVLEPKAIDVLIFLMDRAGQLVSKQDLMAGVWHDVAVTDNALTRVVAQLRRALGDEARHARYVETVPTRGYRFVAGVERVTNGGEAPGRAAPAAAAIALSSHGMGWRRAGTRRLTLVVATVAIATAVVWVWAGRRPAAAAGRALVSGPPIQLTSSRGLDMFPALSPDGGSMVYASDRAGALELWLTPLEPGGREFALTSNGQDNCEPAWSPDGRLIAYHSARRGGIWIIPALGGAPRQLASFGSRPAFSPDGVQIAFQSDGLSDLLPNGASALPGSTLWVVAVERGAPRRVTNPGEFGGGDASPVWAPDGSRIAFTSHTPHGTELWTVDPAGRQPRRLAGGNSTVFDPVYAPDGRTLYFATAKEPYGVWRIGVASNGGPEGEPSPLFLTGQQGARHLSVSRDGRSIAYAALTTTSNLWRVEVAPSREAASPPRAFTNDTSHRNTLPAFAPDGRRVAFVARRGGLQPDIWIADADGSHAVPLTTDPGPDVEPQWFPDADRVLFASFRGDRAGLWETRVSTRQDRPLDLAPALAEVLQRHKVRQFQLHPDGRTLAFAAAEAGVYNLWTAGLDGGDARQITFDRESITFPRWSRDGRSIAAEIKRGEDTQIAIIPAGGGPARIVTSGRGQHWVQSWSPDSRQLAFAGLVGGRWNIWSVDALGGAPRRLTDYDRPNVYVRYPTWSPLGDRIVYEYGEITGNIWVQRLAVGR